MRQIKETIKALEERRSAVDQAIAALSTVSDSTPATERPWPKTTRERWAVVRDANVDTNGKAPSAAHIKHALTILNRRPPAVARSASGFCG